MADEPVNPILETHPMYDRYQFAWRMYYDAWRGGLSWNADRYMFRHPRERHDEFWTRKRRAYYYNLAGPIIEAHTANLYRPTVTRELEGAEDFLLNCDRRGTSFETFMHRVSDFSKVFGHVFVLVDRPRFPELAPATLAAAQEVDLDPFCVMILPFDVLDWETDDHGTLLWAKIRERADRKMNPLIPRGEERYQYKIWTRTEWALYSAEGHQVRGGFHGLGRVPIVPVYFRRTEDPVVGHSLLSDIAGLCRSVYNWCSLLDQILYDQTFSILTYPDDGGVVLGEKVVGTARALTYPHDGSGPAFISPDAAQAELLARQINEAIRQIKDLGLLLEHGISNISTETKRYDFGELNNSLARQAANLQEGEENILDLRGAWLQEDFQGTVQYPSEFNVTSLEQDLEVAAQVEMFDLGETFTAEIRKRLAQKVLPQLGPDKRAKVEKEIEERVKKAAQIIQGAFPGSEPPPGGGGRTEERQAA